MTPENLLHDSVSRDALIWPFPSPNKVGILNQDYGAQSRACIPFCQRLIIILTDNRS